MKSLLKFLYAVIFVFGLVSKSIAAELVVPFSDGFFGDHNDGSTITANNVQLFSTIGLDLNFFAQSSGGINFEDADTNTLESISCNGGNDVPGRLRIRAGGYFTDIPGCIDGKYKDGGTTKAYNFNPSAAGAISFTNATGGTTTINIQDNSFSALNIGVIKNPYAAAEIDPTNTSDRIANGGDGDGELDDGEDVSGDSSGVLADLNIYLSLAQANEPSGPISVVSVTYPTSETSMVISGSVTLAAGEEVYIIIDGRLYTSSSGQVSLTNNPDGSKTWSVNLGQKSAGIYEVSAWIIDDDNWILQDSSTNELTVTNSLASIAQTTNASENNGGSVTNGLFTVTLSNASATDTVIAYTVAGTATSGTDFTALSGSLTITAGSTTGTISVPVTEDTIIEGSETVIVTLSSISSGLASLSGTASDLTATVTIADDDGSSSAAMLVTKTADTSAFSSPVSAGDALTYTITAKNTGNVTLDNVRIADALTPTGGSASALTPTINATATGTADDDNELDVGETWTWTVSYTLTQSDIDAGGLSNLATVTADDPSNTAVSVESSTSGNATSGTGNGTGTSTTFERTSLIDLVKTASLIDTTGNGSSTDDYIKYEFTVTNLGNTTLTDVKITDDDIDWADSNDEIINSVTLTPGESKSFTKNYPVKISDIDVGSIQNQATVVASSPTSPNAVTDLSGPTAQSNEVTVTFLGSITGHATNSDGTAAPGTNVEIYDLNVTPPRLISATVTSADGSYFVNELPSGTYGVKFSAVNKVVQPSIINLVDSDNNAQITADMIKSIDIATGKMISENADVFLVDPSGIVYDSVSRTAIPGASVSLLKNGNLVPSSEINGAANPQITGNEGKYAFYFSSPASTDTYSLKVEAQNYKSADGTLNTGSQIITPSDNMAIASGLGLTLIAEGHVSVPIGAGVIQVVPLDAVPNAGDPETYYMSFDMTFNDWQSGIVSKGIVHNHIPLDPSNLNRNIKVTKTGSLNSSVEGYPVAGDIVTFTIKVENLGNVDFSNLDLDDPKTLDQDESLVSGDLNSDQILNAGETWIYRATYKLSKNDLDLGRVKNLATITVSSIFGTEIYESSPDGNTTAGLGNGSETIVLFDRLIDLVKVDLEEIIEADLTATMRKQSSMMQDFASKAAKNLSEQNSAVCVHELNEHIQRDPILFEPASSQISAAGLASITGVIDILKRCEYRPLGISGHTDSIGSLDYNKDLSSRRISAVLSEFEKSGIDISLFIKFPLGEEKPVANNSTAQGRAKNRRVEFHALEERPTVETDSCRSSTNSHPEGSLKYTETLIKVQTKLYKEHYDCAKSTRRVIDAQINYSNEDDLLENLQSHFSMRKEQKVGSNKIFGSFASVYMDQNEVLGTNSGSIKGVGLSGGIYGADILSNGLIFDYYLGASLGKHEFDLLFNKQIKISATGDYEYAAGYLGAAISGELSNSQYLAKPRAGFNFSSSSNIEVKTLLSHDVREENAKFTMNPISSFSAFAEITLSNKRKNITHYVRRNMNLVPRVFCDQKLGATSTQCGFGIAANSEILNSALDRGLNFNLELLQNNKFRQFEIGFSSQNLMFANGDTKTTAKIAENGKLGLQQLFKWDF